MIVANNLSGLTEVFLGNESIAQVYYGSNLVWPIEPPSIPMKLMFTTDMDEEVSFDCSHTGKRLHTSTAYPSYVLTDSEVLDLAYDNGMSGKTVTSITIGNCTEEIVDNAFSFRYKSYNKNYKSIENIMNFNMGNGVKKVGVNAFSNGYSDNKWNTNLTSFTLSNNLETIGKFAFDGCHLKGVIIPDTVKVIDTDNFKVKEYESDINPSFFTDLYNNNIGTKISENTDKFSLTLHFFKDLINRRDVNEQKLLHDYNYIEELIDRVDAPNEFKDFL